MYDVIILVTTPVVISYLEKKGIFNRRPWLAAPLQMSLVAACLTLATPLCCAIFSQRAAIPFHRLETDIQVRSILIKKKCNVQAGNLNSICHFRNL